MNFFLSNNKYDELGTGPFAVCPSTDQAHLPVTQMQRRLIQ